MEMRTTQHRIIHCEQHYVTRLAMFNILRENFPNTSYQCVSSIKQLDQFLSNEQFSLIILDTNVLSGDSVNIVTALRRRNPKVSILIFSELPELIYAKHYLRLGVNGYLSKECSYSEIIDAISKTLAEEIYLSGRLANHILKRTLVPQATKNPFERFSHVELIIIEMLLHGYWIKHIAEKLRMKQSTISNYKRKAFSKLGISNIVELSSISEVYLNS